MHWKYKLFFNQRLQKVRMDLLKKMLKTREENQANILVKRLDRLWVKKQKEKESKIKKLRTDNIKSNFFLGDLFCWKKISMAII